MVHLIEEMTGMEAKALGNRSVRYRWMSIATKRSYDTATATATADAATAAIRHHLSSFVSIDN